MATKRKIDDPRIKKKLEIADFIIYKRLKLSGSSESVDIESIIDPIQLSQEILRGNDQKETSKDETDMSLVDKESDKSESIQLCTVEQQCSNENILINLNVNVQDNEKRVPRRKNFKKNNIEDESETEESDDLGSYEDICPNRMHCNEISRALKLISLTGRKGNKYSLDAYHSDIIARFYQSTSGIKFASNLDYEFSCDLCFVCNEKISTSDDSLRCWECDELSCHTNCLKVMKFGSYTAFHAILNGPEFEGKVHCPRHFCVKCFAMRLHNRAFQNDLLIPCRMCASSYHPCCIPAGCVIDEKSSTIVCPRHLIIRNFPHRPSVYCASCNRNRRAELIQCTNCCRSFHQKCNKSLAYDPNSELGQRCEDCLSHNFVIVGDRVYAQYGNHPFHPAIVVPNEDYPRDDVIDPGSLVVKWIGSANASFSIVDHYSVIPCTEETFFFNFSHINNLSEHLEFYNQAVEDENKIPPPLTLKFAASRNRKVRIVNKLVPSEPVKKLLSETKLQNQKKTKDIGFDSCNCAMDVPNRCSTDNCDNRIMGLECPVGCGKDVGCGNRLSSHRYKDLKVDKTANRGFGLFAKVEIEKETYIGEYCGELITIEEYEIRNRRERLWKSRDKGFYMFKNGSFFIDADIQGGILRYANHSCEPNCVMRALTDSTGLKHICMYAKRNIAAGEELTFDYCGSSKHPTSNAVTYDCYCGAENCKGEFTV